MDSTNRKLNRAAVCLQLSQAKLALDAAYARAESGAYDEDASFVVACDFQQLLMHVCLAWHFREMTDEAIASLPQEEFDRLANSVPNFGFALRLMPGIESEV